MTESVLMTLIIVGGVLSIAFPILWLIKRHEDGVTALENTKRSILANRLREEEKQRLIK